MGGGRIEPWDLLGCFPFPRSPDHIPLKQVVISRGVIRTDVNVDGEICYGPKTPGF